MTTGQKIQNRRKSLGLSQDQLAAQLNVSRQSISKWEQDIALPDLQNGVELCRVLGMTIEELLHKDEQAVREPLVENENAFQSAEKFVKKVWYYYGWVIAGFGVAMTLAAFVFKSISSAMNQQANSMFDGILGGFGGFFGNRPNVTSVFNPLLDGMMVLGMVIMVAGISIFFYGQYKKRQMN